MYIPFKKEELSKKTIEESEYFREGSEFQRKKFKVIYHGECDLSTLPKYSKLYVIGHGINISPDSKWESVIAKEETPYEKLKHLPFHDWGYSISGGEKAISIDTVAQRIMADGLSKADHIHIKLWFCDPANKAFPIAERFVSNFQDLKNAFRIDYYQNKILYSPGIKDGAMHKWARDEKNGIVVRASSVRGSLFFGNYCNDKAIVTPCNDTLIKENKLYQSNV